ncbi:MAG: HAD family hydrolase [Nostoc sp. EkiNYC01]|nr:NIF family HAD-type phosphatase [Nostoc sp. EkiNYC01]
MHIEPEIQLILFDLDDTLVPTKDLENLRHSKDKHNLKDVIPSYSITPYPGIENALMVLMQLFKLGIVTSAPLWYTSQMLQIYFSKVRFDPVITYDHVEFLKPHPEPIYQALSCADIRNENAIFVGNDQVDYLASKSAGVRFFGAKWSDQKSYRTDETVELKNPMDLIYLIKSLKE